MRLYTDNEFPGLYMDALPKYCWASDNTTVLVSSIWHSKVELLAVNTVSGDLIKLSRDETVGSWQVGFNFILLTSTLLKQLAICLNS